MSEEQTKKRRVRSPAFPAIHLGEAVERAGVLWEKENKHPSTLPVIGNHWGLSAKSSSLATIASSLLKYGLLIEDGRSNNRTLKLSERALKILLGEEEERKNALKSAALAPKLNSDLWERYGPQLPSDESLRSRLLLDFKFNPTSVDDAISVYKATIEFAELSADDKIEHDDHDPSSNIPPSVPNENAQAARVHAMSPAKELAEPAPVAAARTQAGTVLPDAKEFSFPVSAGTIRISGPFPVTREDFESLINGLEAAKGGLVTEEGISLVADGADAWKRQAQALVRHGVKFELQGFDFSRHIEFCDGLALKSNFRFSFNPKKALGFFEPLLSSPKTNG